MKFQDVGRSAKLEDVQPGEFGLVTSYSGALELVIGIGPSSDPQIVRERIDEGSSFFYVYDLDDIYENEVVWIIPADAIIKTDLAGRVAGASRQRSFTRSALLASEKSEMLLPLTPKSEFRSRYPSAYLNLQSLKIIKRSEIDLDSISFFPVWRIVSESFRDETLIWQNQAN